MKYEISIHPASEKPHRRGWYIILDRIGRWRKGYYNRSDNYWDPPEISYWSEMPEKSKLDYISNHPKGENHEIRN